MRIVVVTAMLVALLGSVSAAAEEWQEAVKTEVAGRALTVSSRQRPGSDVREVRGLGSFAAPPWVIKNVVDDVEHYKDFMPYTKTSTQEKGGDGYIISYQRLEVPLADDRDYTIKIFDESTESAAGVVVWKNRWSSAESIGRAPIDGVVRIAVNEGYWQLEDLDGGKHTKATYYVYTNPGGALPAFLVNAANTQAVPDLFKAVAKAAAEPRYQKTRPVPRTSLKPTAAPASQPLTPPPATATTTTTTAPPPTPLPATGGGW